jgi:ABC-2 type transport system ATP-binding protein
MTSENLLEARDLSRRYGATTAVRSLSLTLAKGEILGLLGPNGAGKSTTLKMLAGCLAPSGGTVLIKGIDLSEEPKKAKSQLGYLPEQPPVYPELTVDEYLGYCAGLHGVPVSQRAAAVTEAKRGCGLTEVSHRLIGNLSKGYQQRVGIAQAIIHQPAVVILDEPTVGLDPNQIREIRTLIATLGQNHSVILSSHILPEIQAVCSRVMIVDKGRVVYSGGLDVARAGGSILVGFSRGPASVEAFNQIPGVAKAQALNDSTLGQPAQRLFRITPAENADPREAIVEAAVTHRWGLTELRAEAKTLEELFVELTSGEVVVHEPARETTTKETA